jgi:hypothetical protein
VKVAILNAGADTAGCGIALKRAFDRYGIEARAICRQESYLDYPTDIIWPIRTRQPAQVTQIIREADVIHVMDHEYALGNVAVRDLHGKVIVVHHLGTNFRRAPAAVSRYCRRFGATEVTDSLDLAVLGRVPWLPVPADLEAIAPLRDAYRPSERIRIAHAPTNRVIKSTDLIIATVARLAERYPIDFDLIEGVSNRECIERKALADIFIDELTLGFGLNFIECAAMGIPVVSGLADPAARDLALAMWGQFPWADATAETLRDVLEGLVRDADARVARGEWGRAHVEHWHSQPAVVAHTVRVYEQAGLKVAA